MPLTANSSKPANRSVTNKVCEIAFTILRECTIDLISEGSRATRLVGKTAGYRNFSKAVALFLHLVPAVGCAPRQAVGGNPRNLDANIIAQIRFFW